MNKDFAKGMIVSLALKSLPVRKKSPIAYLYNGVRLPALPEWDREAYPYALMWGAYSWTGYTYYLDVCAEIFYDGSNIGVSGGYQRFFCPEGNPTKWSSSTSGEESLVCSIASVMWANFDVMGENGAVVLAKSTPIPIYNEPVNYLYNGVKLPKLPEWDKTVYPYATLYYQNGKDSSTTEYIFLLVTAQEYSWKSSYQLQTYGPGYVYRYLIDGGTEWEYVREIGSNSEDHIANYFFWTTHDILNKDGDAVYLAASEPIPVYE